MRLLRFLGTTLLLTVLVDAKAFFPSEEPLEDATDLRMDRFVFS
jgi:hypothetical protein